MPPCAALDGDISGTITAVTGDATVTTSAQLTKSVTAGANASVFAFGNVTAAVTAEMGDANVLNVWRPPGGG